MKSRIAVWILILFWGAWSLEAAQIDSLSQLYLMGKGVLDLDQDGCADQPALTIFLPDKPTASELAVAGDLSARINLESLAVDFSLVYTESEPPAASPSLSVLIGGRLRTVAELKRRDRTLQAPISENQGLIQLVTLGEGSGVVLIAGSDQALLKTGRAFFLRWPYLWDVWGRQQGKTYMTVEADLKDLLIQEKIQGAEIATVSAFYDFPPLKSSFDAVKRLEFHPGEIRELTLRVRFSNPIEWESARSLLRKLAKQHRRGRETEVLSYAGCARIVCVLEHKANSVRVDLDRVGYPKRMLTPGYRSPQKPRIPRRDFDLLGFLTTGAAYGDADSDGIPDQLRTRIVLPREAVPPDVTRLAARLVLNTAGASFPLISLDSEIEEPKALDSPILIGEENILVKELIRTGKLKTVPLQPNQAVVQVVPQAFNASNALVFTGGDISSEGAALRFFSQTFPYLTHFQEGEPSILRVPDAIADLLSGEHGSAEAFIYHKLVDTLKTIQDKSLESLTLKLHLPQKNSPYVDFIESYVNEQLNAQKVEVASQTLEDTKLIFSKNQELVWEGREALDMLKAHIDKLEAPSGPVSVSLGLSESPQVRSQLEGRIRTILQESGLDSGEIMVLSAYKAGFFWLTERILPRLKSLEDLDHVTIRFRQIKDDFTRPQRFYADPYRWLQELYPVDEFLARLPSLPLERIDFEAQDDSEDVYEILAYASDNSLLFRDSFSPRTRRLKYLKALPEWGDVEVSTGWLTIQAGRDVVADLDVPTDLERFWEFYQDQVLSEVYDHILKKTGNRPAFAKQPYFKRLLIDLKLSEPDYRLGLDEEIVSSLEAIHDEIYFDTLDFLRGITEIELEEKDEEIPEDSSRYSAPGNILPRIHPSLEGEQGRVEVTLEDWQVRSPQVEISWQEPGRRTNQRKFVFPKIKTESVQIPGFVYDGTQERIDRLMAAVELKGEKDYLALLDILDSLELLHEQNLVPSLELPGLGSLRLQVKHESLTRESRLPVRDRGEQMAKRVDRRPQETPIVPSQEIISPEMCLRIVEELSGLPAIRTYIAGFSYQERRIPVLEVFTPRSPYVSFPRLITAKPTLYLSGRQHANEVSSTNYILKFAELLASDPVYQEYTRKVNFVLHPLENPDGAALAYELQKLTPFHSLHAGRYSSLGIDIGYQTGSSRPLLPEAQVRGKLHRKWLPDIYLNLHGYPSHEWVQPFSGYAPYLFRDYWIPRGWFAYVRAVSLPLYPDWVAAGKDVMRHIVQGMQEQADIHASNRRFYDRYYRWAARWHPHMNYLERYDGVNMYAQRRSGRESRLSDRRRMTYVEETPELMDETAQGEWLDFLIRQGLTYVRAHADYLAKASFICVRIEEESRDRVHIAFARRRPGTQKR
jgi:hypothetical protein